MIVSFKYKGLERFFLKGDRSKLQPAHVGKIRLILAALHAANMVQDMNVPGWNLHILKGNLRDH